MGALDFHHCLGDLEPLDDSNSRISSVLSKAGTKDARESEDQNPWNVIEISHILYIKQFSKSVPHCIYVKHSEIISGRFAVLNKRTLQISKSLTEKIKYEA